MEPHRIFTLGAITGAFIAAILFNILTALSAHSQTPGAPELDVAGTGMATLKWNAVIRGTKGEVLTAPVTYSGRKGINGKAKKPLFTGLSALTYIDRNLPKGRYCYVVWAIYQGTPGSPSKQGCKTIP